MNKLLLVALLATTQLPSTKFVYDQDGSMPVKYLDSVSVNYIHTDGKIEVYADPNTVWHQVGYMGEPNSLARIIPNGWEFVGVVDSYLMFKPLTLADGEIIVVDGDDYYYDRFDAVNVGGRVLRKAPDTAYHRGGE